VKRFLLALLLLCNTAWAAGTAGLTYEFYRGTGPSPSLNPLVYPTVIKTGISPTINYSGSWGGTNSVLDTGYWDRFIVRWYGFINVPTAGTYTFGGNSDDGLIIKIDNTTVVNAWFDSGGAFKTGTPITLAAGVVPVEIWYYENGGGQSVNFQWNLNNTWQVVGSTYLATDSTYWTPVAPTLCCGGSSAAITVNPTHTNKINTFTNRSTNDSQVYIEQIGNSNEVTVDQSGTKNNSATYTGNGSFNNVDITQSSTTPTATNYTELTVNGDSNTVGITQQSTGGTKGAFVNITDNNNSVTVLQKDSGSHYLNLNLSGGNKTADVTQQGSAGHQADITLSGAGARSINLIQQGTTQQSYSINSTCASNCQAITVTQGQ